jgi:hypothetical protein
MLSERFPSTFLDEALLPSDAWHPFPTAEERGPWEALPEEIRAAQVTQGESLLGYDWPPLLATRFLEFKRTGNRSNFQNVRYARRHALRDLVLAECVQGQGRFLDEIVNGIWLTCEETYWGIPAHVGMQAAGVDLPDVEEPTVDLFAAETGALLAWADYLLAEALDTVSPLVRRRIHHEVQRRVLAPCLARDDFWWMGFHPGEHGVNNWNPWINSNWLTMILLLERDADRRMRAVAKVLRSLDVFLDVYHEDGGCDEGPGYWGRAAASLFDCLELLHSATEGALDVFDEAKIQNMGRYIYRAHIHDDYFVNFADASAIVHPVGSLLFRYGRAIDDDALMRFGAHFALQQDAAQWVRRESLARKLPALFSLDELLATKPAQPLPRDVWLSGIQVMAARDRAGAAAGLYLAAKGGHNAESHNHNDIGNFIVYADGKPVIVDAGVETYTRKTFSPQRYEIWTMQSAYHTLLPTIDGAMQAPGRAFAARAVAYTADEARAQFSLDIAEAYPPAAHLASWVRTFTFNRGGAIDVTDRYELTQPAAIITLSLLTPCDLTLAPGTVRFAATAFGEGRGSGAATLHYDADAFEVAVSPVEITDRRLGGVWGDRLHYVRFETQGPPQQGAWTFTIRRS